MKARVLAIVLAVAASCPLWVAAEPANAGCAGPSIAVEPSEGPPGGTVSVTGRHFSHDCNDARGVVAGIACNRPGLASRPERGIDLVLIGPDRERVLATVDGFDFEHEVAIPPDTPPGEATIQARIGSNSTGASPVPFTVTTDEPVAPRPGPMHQVPLPAHGYLLAASDGGVFAFGARPFHGSASNLDLNAPVVGIASSAEGGYWLAAGDGGVFAYGPAEFLVRGAEGLLFDGEGEVFDQDYGCEPSVVGPVIGVAARRVTGGVRHAQQGYWTTTRRGYVFRFNAGFFGATFPFYRWDVDHGPVVALAAHPGGYGYWQATENGGVFAFGEAPFAGSLADVALQAPIVAMAANPTGKGYWLAAADGGVFAFGDAPFRGSLGGQRLNAAVVGIAAAPDGNGYWLTAADGGVFAFGSAPFLGSLADIDLNGPIVGITT